MEADKALHATLESELKSLHEKHQSQMREMQMGVNASIDALSRSFAELASGLREEKEQRRADIEHVLQTLVVKVRARPPLGLRRRGGEG